MTTFIIILQIETKTNNCVASTQLQSTRPYKSDQQQLLGIQVV